MSHLQETFVGRQRELGALKAVLDDALAGHGRIVMLAGEPGIGKTRLAQELATVAEPPGFHVLWGRCYEELGAPPYWPWVQPIRAYVRACDAEQLRSVMGAGASDIAEVVPEVAAKLTGLAPSPSLDPEQARFRLFDSIASFLKNASASRPLLLVLDDLHWADRSSLLLLEFIAREMGSSRLLMLGTYRDVEVSRRHPLSQTLGNLVKEPVFQRVNLRGLGQQEVGQLIESTAGAAPAKLVKAVHERTEGNPLFVGEIARLLKQEGLENVGQSWDNHIPEGIKDAIGRRLVRLSEGCTSALTVASVIGREFPFRLLAHLLGDINESQMLEVLDEALSAHIIEAMPGRNERYQFAHALIQQTLYEDISTSRRVRLHSRIAEGLEGMYGDSIEAHAAELAYHLGEAQAMLGIEKLVRYSAMAGERALAAYAFEDALAHFQRALAAIEGRSMDSQKAALLFGLARAQHAMAERYQLKQAVDNFMLAFDYYIEIEDMAHALEIAEYPIRSHFSHAIGKLHAKALSLLPTDSHQAGRLLPRHGGYLLHIMADYEGAMDAFNQALAIAQRENDVPLQVRALQGMGSLYHEQLRWSESLDFHSRAVELARGTQMPGDAWGENLWQALICSLGVGDLKGARRHGAEMLAQADHSRMSRTGAYHYNSIVAAVVGDWATARDFNDRALDISPRDFRPLHERVLLEYQLGNFDQGRAFMERLLEVVRLLTPGDHLVHAVPSATIAGDHLVRAVPSATIAAVARITGATEWLEVAEEAARAVLSAPQITLVMALRARLALALMATQWGDAAAAAKQYTAMESYPRIFYTSGGCYYTIDRLLGLLAHMMGRLDAASAHFEAALAFCRKAGYRPELAWTCHDYASLLREQGQRDKALALLDEALSISTELGIRPLMEKAAALREGIVTQLARARKYPANLTEHQVQVLRLIAAGKTSREIAEALVLSERTVHRHAANIYAKIGARNRTEATAFALRELYPIT